MIPRRGAIAQNEDGDIGIISDNNPYLEYHLRRGDVEVWYGVQAEGKHIGEQWKSENPEVLGYIEEFRIEGPNDDPTRVWLGVLLPIDLLDEMEEYANEKGIDLSDLVENASRNLIRS